LSVSGLPVGVNSLAIVYSGDAAFAGSERLVSVTIRQVSTKVDLDPLVHSSFGDPVTFTARVSALDPLPLSGLADGVVEFFRNGVKLQGAVTMTSPGVYEFTTDPSIVPAQLPVGNNTIVARYTDPLGNFKTSTSAPKTQTVDKTGTSTTLSLSSSTIGYGEQVTLTANVTSGAFAVTPGSVSFYAGTVLLQTASLDATGTATYVAPARKLNAGTYSIVAKFVATANLGGSDSSVVTPQTLVVSPVTSKTTLLAGSVGTTAVFSATVAGDPASLAPGQDPGPVSGSVTFYRASGAALGTISTNTGGTFTLKLPLSSVTDGELIRAKFTPAPAAAVNWSVSEDTQAFVKADTVTTTTVSSSATWYVDRPTSLTATVSTGFPGVGAVGTVTFVNDLTGLALPGGTNVPLVGGKASLSVAANTWAIDTFPSVTATYNPPATGFLGSSGQDGQGPLRKYSALAIGLTQVGTTGNYNVSVTLLTANNTPNTFVAGQTVDITVGGQVVTVTLNASGKGTTSAIPLAKGTQTITAAYATDGTFASATASLTTVLGGLRA